PFRARLVADIAIAGRPEPVPVIEKLILGERHHWRGTAEFIPIDSGGHRLDRRVSDGFPALKAEASRHVHFADDAILKHLDRAYFMSDAAALRADLHDAAILARRRNHLHAFVEIVASGLFNVNILAGLARPHCG